jgi:thiol-disulfide isomerase/thioredoxin
MVNMTRVRAPELRGRGWLNTGGRQLSIKDLRGKIVLLDFWTFCCINCLHVLEELRPLEEQYGDALVVIGVHSPKFEHERDPVALADAVERYGVTHPVLDDPELITWDQYAAKAWPTLAVVDPDGYLVESMAGEGHAPGLRRLLDELIATHEAKGTLHRGDGPYVPPPPPATELRFPGKATVLPGGTLLISDSSHHSLAEVDADAVKVLRRFGSGRKGRADGTAAGAEFAEPGGACLLRVEVAAAVGYDIVVADTVNHLLRGVALASGTVTTVAGTGNPWRTGVDFDAHPAGAVDLSSPWDVAWFDGRVMVAMAGIHQLWWFDPASATAGVFAGTTVESLRDGALEQVWLAQPSGLSVSADGGTLWFVDSESSALRHVRRDGSGELVMSTVVGQGLFDFGHMDGPTAQALLQHPLGVCALPDGSVLVADTYNGAVRRYDPGTDSVSTVVTGLAEPSDVVLLPDGGVLVVESAAHRITALAPGAVAVAGSRHRLERTPVTLAPGEVSLEIIFTPAPGQQLDESFGPSTRLEVTATPPELLVAGAGVTRELNRTLVIAPDIAGGVLQVTAQAATCDADVDHAACHLTRQDWGVPVVVGQPGATRLPLVLRGLDPTA